MTPLYGVRHPGAPFHHPKCTTDVRALSVYSVKEQPPLVQVVEGRLDIPCVQRLMSGLDEEQNPNVFQLGVFSPLERGHVVMKTKKRAIRIPRGCYWVENPKENAALLDTSEPFAGMAVFIGQVPLREFREAVGIPRAAGPFDFVAGVQKYSPLMRAAMRALVQGAASKAGQYGEDWLPLLMSLEGKRLLGALWEIHPSELKVRLAKQGFRTMDGRLGAAVAYLRRHMARPLQYAELANAAGLGRTTLYRLFKGKFGCPPHEYLRRLRVQDAERRLLEQPSLEFALLAEQVGFQSPGGLRKALAAIRRQREVR